MSTCSPLVNEMSDIHLSGNITPVSWFTRLRIETKKSTKPDLHAICLLSDIVYWYRKTEVRDEETGDSLGFKNRFAGDYLQRSYKQIAEKYGVSKSTAIDIVARLKRAGLIRTVLRNITTANGTKLNNVQYIIPIPEAIKSLCSDDEVISVKTRKTLERIAAEDNAPYTESLTTPIRNVPYTNTETINTKTSVTPSGVEHTSSLRAVDAIEKPEGAKRVSTQKSEPKKEAHKRLTARGVHNDTYRLTANAMQGFQQIVNDRIAKGFHVNLHLNAANQLTVNPDHLPEIESNLNELLEYRLPSDNETQFLVLCLVGFYSKRCQERPDPVNFAFLTGIGLKENYAQFMHMAGFTEIMPL